MATSVFGAPMTRKTLKRREEYQGQEFSTREMAELAFLAKNEDGKDLNARSFLEERRLKYAIDFVLCLIYNATGDTMKLHAYCDAGDGFVSPSPYPMIIMNGQWGAYMKRGGGAVVYTVRNEQGYEYQVVYSYQPLEPGRVYTEIRSKDYYKPKDPWQSYVTTLYAQSSYTYQANEYGLASFATIGGTTRSPVFEGIITLDGTWSDTPVPFPYGYNQPGYNQQGYNQQGYNNQGYAPRAALVYEEEGSKEHDQDEADEASMASENK